MEYRIITEKDKRGLLLAFRVFVRAMNGERIPTTAGNNMLQKALNEGLSFDEILNKENWGRAQSVSQYLNAKDYIDTLCERRVEVKRLTEEPEWYEIHAGWRIVAEAVHDFYAEVANKGGKWNIPSALKSLAKAVKAHSLQALMSEKLILAVKGEGEEKTFFDYISAILADFNTLPIDDAPTREQEYRNNEEVITTVSADEAPDEEETEDEPRYPYLEEDEFMDPYAGVENPDAVDNPEEQEQPGEGTGIVPVLRSFRLEEEEPERPEDEDNPDDDPVPDYNAGFETAFIVSETPRDIKRSSLKLALMNYTPRELAGLIDTVEGGRSLSLSELIDVFTDGKFEPGKESPEARNIHMSLIGDMTMSFIACVQSQGIEMNEELAEKHDILKESWDLRDPNVRKLHKLKLLIYTEGKDDPDLLACVKDIEEFYSID